MPRSIGGTQPEAVTAVRDKRMPAQIDITRRNRIDFGPEIARRAGERRHRCKTKSRIDADKHVARQAAQPVKHAAARPDA